MMSEPGKSSAKEAQKFFKEICDLHGWELKDLAQEAGYRLETLQKAMRPKGGVTFNDRMRETIKNASDRAMRIRNLAVGSGLEAPPSNMRAMEPVTPYGDPTEDEIIVRLAELIQWRKESRVDVHRRELTAKINALRVRLKRLLYEASERLEQAGERLEKASEERLDAANKMLAEAHGQQGERE